MIEAVFEDLAVKHRVLRDVEPELAPDAVYASNTSTIPIAQIAQAAAHPERVLGMHFFSPVHKMPLLEVIATPQTTPEAIVTAVAYGRRLGKTVIVGAHGLPSDELDPIGPLVYAVHEVAVQAAGRALEALGVEATWARAERIALVAAETVLRGTVIAERWAAWRASLGTGALIAEADLPEGVVEATCLALVGPSA